MHFSSLTSRLILIVNEAKYLQLYEVFVDIWCIRGKFLIAGNKAEYKQAS